MCDSAHFNEMLYGVEVSLNTPFFDTVGYHYTSLV